MNGEIPAGKRTSWSLPCLALLLGAMLMALSLSQSATTDAATASSPPAVCHTVIVKVHARHWVWTKKTHRIHGHRVLARRHGKIVYVRVRVGYTRHKATRVCTGVVSVLGSSASATPSAPPLAPTPSPLAPSLPGEPAWSPPLNTSPPTISGTAQQGQTLTANPGSWTNSPTGYGYEWLRCGSGGGSCIPIAEATASTYVLTEIDVGSTLRVSVIASNGSGPSAPASSAQTAVVAAPPGPPVNTSAPTISGTAQQGQTLTANPGSWTNSPTGYGYEWLRCGSGGGSCKAIAEATASTYVLTEIDVGSTLRVSVIASNGSGPSAPASSAQTALVTALPSPPLNTSPPTISGTAQQGQTLTANPGSWTNSPTGYGYEWLRCGSGGGSCIPIAEATASTYVLTEIDVGSTLRVSVIASNGSGPSAPASSAQTAVVTTSTGVSHLEYVLQDGTTWVYDMDNEFKLVKTIPMPQDSDGVRGVSVAPSTHTMYVMHGGDGPINGSGNGSVLAWDLVGEKAVWDSKLSTGIDSGQVSPDGKKLYIPTGENTSTGLWSVLSATTGELLGTIQGGSAAHNTVVSADGRYVYMGGRTSNILYVYETETGKTKQIGPMIGTVRPLTANGSNTLAFTTATNFDGFQVSSVTTGKVLFTVSFGEVPKGFRFTAPSHGISISPDEKQAYVIDAVHKLVQVYDISKVKEGIAPSQIGTVAVAGLGTGNETGCKYDCEYGGWLQLSTDGRYLFVGDSGEVIDTATRKVVTTLSTLAQTKLSIEIDWQNGVPVATSGRTGVGDGP
jgi:hypothetical protein